MGRIHEPTPTQYLCRIKKHKGLLKALKTHSVCFLKEKARGCGSVHVIAVHMFIYLFFFFSGLAQNSTA